MKSIILNLKPVLICVLCGFILFSGCSAPQPDRAAEARIKDSLFREVYWGLIITRQQEKINQLELALSRYDSNSAAKIPGGEPNGK